MGVQYMNGWDYLPQGATAGDCYPYFAADGNYGYIDSFQAGPGRFGLGSSLNIYQNGIFPRDRYMNLDHAWGAGGYVMGFAYKINPLGSGVIMRFFNSSTGADVLAISFSNLGYIQFQVAGGTTYRSRIGAYVAEAWFYMQIKHIPGLFEVVINGEIVAHVENPAPPSTMDAMRWQYPPTCNDFMDDFYIIDPATPGHADYLGNIRVGTQLPVGPGDITDLTPVGVVSNYLAAGDYKLPTGKYNYTDIVGESDLYAMSANVLAREVFALQVKGFYTQDNGVQLFGRNQFKLNDVVTPGTQRGLNSQQYGQVSDYWDINPVTGNPFTAAELNVIQVGPSLGASN